MALKSWAWKYQGHDIRAEIWWRLYGWRRERVYIDHDLATQRRGYSLLGSPLRCLITNEAGAEDQIEIRFCRPFSLRLGRFQIAAGPLACRVLVNGLPWKWETGHFYLEKRWINGESDDGFPGLQLGPLWGCIIFPLLFVYAFFVVPIIVFILSLVEYVKELRLKNRLRQQARVVDWADVKRRMSERPSTLIVEKPFLGNLHVWWTEEDVLAHSPFPPTQEHEFWFPGGGTKNPFREWCYHRYLSEDTGKALLVSSPTGQDRKILSNWSHRFSPQKFAAAWKATYPQLQVVVTGFNAYSKKTIEAFAVVLGEGGPDSVRRLATLLQAKDRHLRRLAVNALRMMGPSAEKAMPALIEQLYRGPVGERFDVADALAAIGDDDVDRLREASNRDDPWIRSPAENALAKLGLASGQPQSLIRQFQKRFLSRERFFYLFMQHVTRENVAAVLASLPPSCLKIIKTEVKNPPPGWEVACPRQTRESFKAVREYLEQVERQGSKSDDGPNSLDRSHPRLF